MKPWDARIAATLVRPLRGTRVRPNHLTTLRLVVGLGAVAMLATGTAPWVAWGALLFVLSNLLDHFDGELARLTGQTSRFGHYYDLACDFIVHVAVFAAIGYGLRHTDLGPWGFALGIVGGVAVAAIFWMRMKLEERLGKPAVALNRCCGFESEDVLYLLAPIVWLGWSAPFLVLAAVGAPVYCMWQLWELRDRFSAVGDRRG